MRLKLEHWTKMASWIVRARSEDDSQIYQRYSPMCVPELPNFANLLKISFKNLIVTDFWLLQFEEQEDSKKN